MQLRLRETRPWTRNSRGDAGTAGKGQDDAVALLTSEPSCKDESRIGQKGGLTRQWARRGSRPRQPKDQRYAAAYIFAAVCPAAEKTAALVLPQVDTEAMNLHLAEIARQVDAQAHAVVILDQAGWHGARTLLVPENLTLLSLPPYSPELNPVENLWQFLKHNFLNSRVFADYQAIVDACCDAWNRLRAIPGQIRSITSRTWARTVNI
jgi:DDE superfamily endonuclease